MEPCLAAMLPAWFGFPRVWLCGLDPTQSPVVGQRGDLAARQPHGWDLKMVLGKSTFDLAAGMRQAGSSLG